MTSISDLPFRNLKILDLSQGIAGPYCTHILWQQGATVYKVESDEEALELANNTQFGLGGTDRHGDVRERGVERGHRGHHQRYRDHVDEQQPAPPSCGQFEHSVPPLGRVVRRLGRAREKRYRRYRFMSP